MSDDDLPFLLLAAGNAVVESVQSAMQAHGFEDIRPAHGFAFVRISGPGCTLVDLAEHMGMTKQSTSTLVAELERKGYVARSPHPLDGRAFLIQLTERGVAATVAATEATSGVVRRWRRELGAGHVEALTADLRVIAREGRVRPTW
ncbi:MarR family winged helix-turn-helix transcriptional regulator [Luteipulveratus mongoliensis]|uniref:MarR family winged helix-turn-helix transcriptional regulator n=1 Tax=Luteipulveratus mongoliensis TaxID=571913 RepID=UPI000AF10FBA|nr:MarR family transcriptional regulator [Luteipulveratus mongoliensis]